MALTKRASINMAMSSIFNLKFLVKLSFQKKKENTSESTFDISSSEEDDLIQKEDKKMTLYEKFRKSTIVM